jgi:protein phosphatase
MDFFKRLTGQGPGTPPDQASTAPLDPRNIKGVFVDDLKQHNLIGSAQSGSEPGRSVSDSVMVIAGAAESSDSLPDFGLFCVADGMPANSNSNSPSGIAVRSISRSLTQEALLDLLAPAPVQVSESLEGMVRLAVEKANREVRVNSDGGTAAMTIALVVGRQVTLGHVGDTRAYEVSESSIRQITRDHSVVQQLVETGTMSEQEAVDHPQRDSLWNSLGKAIDIKVDVETVSFQPGERLLICSDGIWESMGDETLRRLTLEALDPQSACNALVSTSEIQNKDPEKSVIIVHFPEESGSTG